MAQKLQRSKKAIQFINLFFYSISQKLEINKGCHAVVNKPKTLTSRDCYLRLFFGFNLLKAMKVTAADREYLANEYPTKSQKLIRRISRKGNANKLSRHSIYRQGITLFFFWLHWELENILTHTLMSLTRATVEGPSKQGTIFW